MEYTEFLRQLGKTALAYAENPDAAVDELPVNGGVGVSGNIEKQVQFDGNGKWSYELSQYCPLNVDVTGSVQSAPEGSVFTVNIDTNYPQHKTFDGITTGQEIKTTIKTNTFSKTRITITITSNKPNTSATFRLHYSV